METRIRLTLAASGTGFHNDVLVAQQTVRRFPKPGDAGATPAGDTQFAGTAQAVVRLAITCPATGRGNTVTAPVGVRPATYPNANAAFVQWKDTALSRQEHQFNSGTRRRGKLPIVGFGVDDVVRETLTRPLMPDAMVAARSPKPSEQVRFLPGMLIGVIVQ